MGTLGLVPPWEGACVLTSVKRRMLPAIQSSAAAVTDLRYTLKGIQGKEQKKLCAHPDRPGPQVVRYFQEKIVNPVNSIVPYLEKH